MKLKIISPRPLVRKACTSALTQRDFAEAGEQITTNAEESLRAAAIVLLKSPALGSSSRSRNIWPSLAGRRKVTRRPNCIYEPGLMPRNITGNRRLPQEFF